MNKKLLTVFASAIMLVGIGSIINKTPTQNVQATIMKSPDNGHIVYDQDTAYNELRRANIVTPYLNYTGKNSVKFHWYKNPHTRSGWDNINNNISFDAFGGSGVENYGIVTTLGTATINGRKYYMYLNNHNTRITLGNSSTFNRPNVIKSKKQLPTYNITGDNVNGYEATDVGYDCPSSVFIIPTHHNSVTFPSREKHGKLDQFIPVIAGSQNGGFGASFIRKADYDYLIKTGYPAKNVHFDDGSILYSKNRKAYVKPDKTSLYWQRKTAESILHNDKYVKQIGGLTKRYFINTLYRELKANMRNIVQHGNRTTEG